MAAHDPGLPDVLAFIRATFAYMDGVVDPPSSMHRMTLDSLRDDAHTREVWVCGAPLLGCVMLTPKRNTLYIGKLCVAEQARGQGLARRFVDLAEARARDLRLPQLTLDVRVELAENHAAFKAMGFVEQARHAHMGYAAPTSINFARPVS